MSVDILGTWFSIALRPRKLEGSLGRTAQDGHLDVYTAPELSIPGSSQAMFIYVCPSEFYD